ncbi:MAG TPA: Ig-like domain-containing protein, partial [Polyangia bacterium]
MASAAGLAACSSPTPTEPQTPTPTPPLAVAAGPQLKGIHVGSGAAMMPDGATQKLVATGEFDDGSTADLTDLVTWRSSDEAVAMVDASAPAGATLFASGPGTVTITATLAQISGSATLTITAVLRMLVISAGMTRIAPCGSRQLVAVASFSDGTQRDVTALAEWSTSDGAVATAGNSDGARGLLSAFAAGPVTISARWGGTGSSLELVADPQVPKMIAVSPTDLTVTAGDSIAFTTTATYCDGSTEDVTMISTWSSSSPAVASIDDVEDGTYVANTAQAGTTWISAQLDNLSDAIKLEVSPPTLRSIFVTAPSDDTNLAAGSSVQFAANAQYSDGSSQDLTAAVTWSSSNPSRATVSNEGLVTA